MAQLRGNGKAAADPNGVRAFTDQEIQQLRERIESSARLGPSDLLAWDCLAGLLLGSETQRVLTHTSLPVLVYRKGEETPAGGLGPALSTSDAATIPRPAMA